MTRSAKSARTIKRSSKRCSRLINSHSCRNKVAVGEAVKVEADSTPRAPKVSPASLNLSPKRSARRSWGDWIPTRMARSTMMKRLPRATSCANNSAEVVVVKVADAVVRADKLDHRPPTAKSEFRPLDTVDFPSPRHAPGAFSSARLRELTIANRKVVD